MLPFLVICILNLTIFVFSLGLKESAEEMVKNKLEGKDKLTPWEQFLEKKKEKKRLKKKQKVSKIIIAKYLLNSSHV